MKIKVLLNLGSVEFPKHPFREGETHDVDDGFGEMLVKRGFAELVAVHAVPAKAAIAESRPAAIRTEKPKAHDAS